MARTFAGPCECRQRTVMRSLGRNIFGFNNFKLGQYQQDMCVRELEAARASDFSLPAGWWRGSRDGQRNADANGIVDGGSELGDGRSLSGCLALTHKWPWIRLCARGVHTTARRARASKRIAKPLLDATNRLISKRHASLAAVLLPQLLPKPI
jgi:hypothetical protein